MITRDHVPRRTDQFNLHTHVIANKRINPPVENREWRAPHGRAVGPALPGAAAARHAGRRKDEMEIAKH